MPTKTKTTKKSASKKKSSAKKGAKSSIKTSGGSAKVAKAILNADNPTPLLSEQGDLMLDERQSVATQAARVLSEVIVQKPEVIVPLVNKFAQGIGSSNKRVVQTAAEGLPLIAKRAPARVARQLDLLKSSFETTTDAGKDGLVRTFAALCAASVAYQKRLEPVLTLALNGADGKTLLTWAQIVLPALKGEPHARARSVVEDRLNLIPRSYAQQIADFLGMKLRVRYR